MIDNHDDEPLSAVPDHTAETKAENTNAAEAIDLFLALKRAHPVRGPAIIRELIEDGRE